MLPNGTAVAIRAVDSRPDGTLDVPSDIRVAGWWRGGSSLGDPFGSTLVAAHVDSFAQGLGPFASLLSVRPGQKVVLTSTHLRAVLRGHLAAARAPGIARAPALDLHGAWPAATAHLVTCAGPYVADRGGYQNLAVITATPTGAAVRAGA